MKRRKSVRAKLNLPFRKNRFKEKHRPRFQKILSTCYFSSHVTFPTAKHYLFGISRNLLGSTLVTLVTTENNFWTRARGSAEENGYWYFCQTILFGFLFCRGWKSRWGVHDSVSANLVLWRFACRLQHTVWVPQVLIDLTMLSAPDSIRESTSASMAKNDCVTTVLCITRSSFSTFHCFAGLPFRW